MIDEKFIARVYRTSAVVWAIGTMLAWSVAGPYAGLGWTVGAGMSVGVLRAIEWAVRRTLRPGDPNAGRRLMKASALHWPIILVAIGVIVWLGRHSVPYLLALVAGLGLVQAVIVLKALGIAILQRIGKSSVC